jgi:hypothetical protein
MIIILSSILGTLRSSIDITQQHPFMVSELFPNFFVFWQILLVMKIHKKPRTWTDSLDKQPKCKKMHEELHNFYSSPNIIRMTKSRRVIWARWEKRNACRVLVGKPEGKRLLGRPRRR